MRRCSLGCCSSPPAPCAQPSNNRKFTRHKRRCNLGCCSSPPPQLHALSLGTIRNLRGICADAAMAAAPLLHHHILSLGTIGNLRGIRIHGCWPLLLHALNLGTIRNLRADEAMAATPHPVPCAQPSNIEIIMNLRGICADATMAAGKE